MIYVFSILIAIITVVFVALITIYIYGEKYILPLDKLPKEIDTIIVLGAGIRSDGKPCDLLADRLETGAMVYLNGNCKTVLLTGDDRDVARNEVTVMKDWIIKSHLVDKILEENILLDKLGLCTYDSMYRAKKNFNINSAIISTNRYHLPRAIYIARRLGIKAFGISSDLRAYDRMKKYKKRELLAQLKDFLMANIKR